MTFQSSFIAHDGPAFGGGFDQALVEPGQGILAVVGIFPLGVGVIAYFTSETS